MRLFLADTRHSARAGRNGIPTQGKCARFWPVAQVLQGEKCGLLQIWRSL